MMFWPRKVQLTSPLTPPVRGVVLIRIGKIWIVREREESFKAKESRTLENKEWYMVLKLYGAELLLCGIVMDPKGVLLDCGENIRNLLLEEGATMLGDGC